MANHYLFIGLELERRQEKIAQLKANLFENETAVRFDVETLDAFGLSAEDFKVALVSVPALSVRKLVVVRNAEKLSRENLELVMRFLEDTPENPVLVLDAVSWDGRTDPRKSLRKKLQVISAAEKPLLTIFQMMDELLGKSAVSALKILKELFDRGDSAEQLLGGVVWYWGNRVQGRVSADKYKKGLLILQEADEALKHSRFAEREQALEVAVVKLWSLLKA